MKNKNKVMEHVFQAEWWAKHPSGCSFGLLWLSKLAKNLKKQRGINWYFVYENNGK